MVSSNDQRKFHWNSDDKSLFWRFCLNLWWKFAKRFQIELEDFVKAGKKKRERVYEDFEGDDGDGMVSDVMGWWGWWWWCWWCWEWWLCWRWSIGITCRRKKEKCIGRLVWEMIGISRIFFNHNYEKEKAFNASHQHTSANTSTYSNNNTMSSPSQTILIVSSHHQTNHKHRHHASGQHQMWTSGGQVKQHHKFVRRADWWDDGCECRRSAASRRHLRSLCGGGDDASSSAASAATDGDGGVRVGGWACDGGEGGGRFQAETEDEDDARRRRRRRRSEIEAAELGRASFIWFSTFFLFNNTSLVLTLTALGLVTVGRGQSECSRCENFSNDRIFPRFKSAKKKNVGKISYTPMGKRLGGQSRVDTPCSAKIFDSAPRDLLPPYHSENVMIAKI